MSNIPRRVTDLETRMARVEAMVGIDAPAPAGPRILPGSRVYIKAEPGASDTAVVLDVPPDDGKYLLELPSGEQFWAHESEFSGAKLPDQPAANHPLGDSDTTPST